MTLTIPVPADATPQALERFVAAHLGTVDYLTVRQWAQAGLVLVDSQPGKASRYVQPGQTITVTPPPPKPHEAVPEDLPLPIRFADDHLVVVAKPAGMATHPGPGWWHGSCVNALLHAITDWPGVGGFAGPGIVHRLDRDTTGILVFAKTDAAHQALLAVARDRLWQRHYLAWAAGRMAGAGTIDLPLGRSDDDPQTVCVREDGKQAITHWQAIESHDDRSLIALRLETGRNHQIRVHLAASGHPILGDPVYGTPAAGLALHAVHLAFAHPITGEALAFTEPTPEAWRPYGPDPVTAGLWVPF
jgi:23S rRNA pseudouridine1911/1915/1917 synthase